MDSYLDLMLTPVKERCFRDITIGYQNWGVRAIIGRNFLAGIFLLEVDGGCFFSRLGYDQPNPTTGVARIPLKHAAFGKN